MYIEKNVFFGITVCWSTFGHSALVNMYNMIPVCVVKYFNISFAIKIITDTDTWLRMYNK